MGYRSISNIELGSLGLLASGALFAVSFAIGAWPLACACIIVAGGHCIETELATDIVHDEHMRRFYRYKAIENDHTKNN